MEVYNVQVKQQGHWIHFMGMLNHETAHRVRANILQVFHAECRVVRLDDTLSEDEE